VPEGDALPGYDLPVFDLLSDEPLPQFADDADDAETRGTPTIRKQASIKVPTKPVDRSLGSLWLEGDVVMCGCPNCRAPMTVRLWLMIADCWQCGASIELTEEQEREALRLMQQREHTKRLAEAQRAGAMAAPKPAPAAPPSRARPQPPASRPQSPTSRPSPAVPPAALKGEPRPPPKAAARPAPPPQEPARRVPASAPPGGARARIRNLAKTGGTQVWLNEVFKLTPAWLVSLVFHFVILTLAALLTFGDEERGPEILLSASISPRRQEGGQMVLDPKDEVQFDLPLPQNVDLNNPQQREAMIKADQEARELRLDPDTPAPHLPELQKVKSQIGASSGARRTFAARDPRVRIEMVQQEGGTTLTEAAVARGLRWMAMHQSENGSWSLEGFNRAPECTCSGTGGIRSDSAATSLVLLPFLGAGQSHLTGRYKDTVAKGLRWLVQQQKPDGDLRANSAGNAGMYAHGQATIVLCEAFAMEGDEELRVPAQKAVDFIVAAQHSAGGWRYSPREAGDTSVVGWQLMALQSARAAGLTVPDYTFELASQYLDSVQSQGGSQYAYQPRRSPTHVMTAEALLCRMYLGWTNEQPGLQEGISYLVKNHLPDPKSPNIYYWYYGTQTFHHAGGDAWEQWNLRMRDLLVNTQEKSGHQAGSWAPRGEHASAGGRIYETALSVCTLEVYYRHLPLFRQIDLK
jgi:hypothetical protein